MGQPFTEAGVFLVEVLFGFYALAVLLRFLFALVRADFYNPIAQFLVTLTNPPLLLLRRLIPGALGIDWAALTLLFAVVFAKILLLDLILGFPWSAGVATARTVVDLMRLTLDVFLFAILIRAVLSWVNPYPNAATQLLARLTEPVIRPLRRLLPATGGFDLSPMVAMVVLVLIDILLLKPTGRVLIQLARG